MIIIENNRFKAAIRTRGAELASFFEKSNGRERIWQADPDVWGGSAPILFPIIGKLKDQVTQIDGEFFEIPKHGLLRHRDAELLKHENDVAVFKFSSDEDTLRLYPFHFDFIVTFQLSDKGLQVSYEISNIGEGPMLFAVGSHPALSLDLDAVPLNEYSIEFSHPETLDLYGLQDGLLVKRQTDYLKDESVIRLSDSLFDDDALIFKDVQSRKITLQPTGIEIDTHDNPHLGIWAKPGAPYVCIEPWHSFDDSSDADGIFENKPGIKTLLPSEIFETRYDISIVQNQ